MINIEKETETGDKNTVQEHVRGTQGLQEGWNSSNSEGTFNKHIRFIDLFGGVGGFRLGLERANNISGKRGKDTSRFRCVGYYDINRYATQVYNKQFGESHKSTDITKVSSDDIPEHDLLCGGFPCQSFSIAGKRGGFEDTRETLFFEIARILRDKRPKMVLLENVKGLLSHDEGRTFGTILNTLAELGYVGQYEVLNSKNFGVPQNRERVFIFGFRGESAPQVFPIGEDNKAGNIKGKELPEQVSNTLRTNYSSGFSNETYVLEESVIYNDKEKKKDDMND